MHGFNFSFRYLEFTDFTGYDQGKDKSWVRHFFETNSPVVLIPKCYATPMGEITRSGVSIALCNFNIHSHPFLIYLTRASLRNFLFYFSDLWFSLPRAPYRSTNLDFHLALQFPTDSHLLALTVGPFIYCDAKITSRAFLHLCYTTLFRSLGFRIRLRWRPVFQILCKINRQHFYHQSHKVVHCPIHFSSEYFKI